MDQDLLDIIEEREELITVLELILETGLPRNRERAEAILNKIEESEGEVNSLSLAYREDSDA